MIAYNRLICLCLSTLLLIGCSTRFVYYWLDTAMIWQLNDYFSLSVSQKNLVQREVKGLMAWHRQHELPLYAQDLALLAKAVASPMDEPQVRYHLDIVQQSLTRTLENTIPRAVNLAKTLTDEQVTKFMRDRVKRQTERMADFKKQSRANMEREFAEKISTRLTFWLGEVKTPQQPLIAQWARWQYELMPPWLSFQESWTGELQRLMAQRKQPDFSQALSRLLAQGDGLMDGRFTGYTQQSRQRTISWLVALSHSLDSAQRAYLYSMLKNYGNDFGEMTKNR